MTQAKGAGPQGGEVAETAWLHARSGPPRGAPRFSQSLGSCCVDSPMMATDFGDKVVGSAAASATSSPVPEPVAQASASTTRPRPSPRPGWCCEPGPLLLSFLDLPASGRGPRLFGTGGSAQAGRGQVSPARQCRKLGLPSPSFFGEEQVLSAGARDSRPLCA